MWNDVYVISNESRHRHALYRQIWFIILPQVPLLRLHYRAVTQIMTLDNSIWKEISLSFGFLDN